MTEAPERPDLVVHTLEEDVDTAVLRLLEWLR